MSLMGQATPQSKEASINSTTRWGPDRAAIVWLLVSAIVAVTIFAMVVIYFPFLPQQNAGAGFRPDWDCTLTPVANPLASRRSADKSAHTRRPPQA
jgi:uncharacterized membrane protein